MNVVIDARYLNSPGSGIATYTGNLLRQLLFVDQENRYGLVTRKAGMAKRFDQTRCYDIIFNAPPRSWRTTKSLAKVLNKETYDVFHSTFNILPSGLRQPSIVTIHDVIPLMDPALVDTRRSFRWTAGRAWRRGLMHAAQNASLLVTISSTSAEEIEKHLGSQVSAKTIVTGSGLDPFFLEPGTNDIEIVAKLIGGHFPYVLTVGQGSPRKNHVAAVRAFERAFAQDESIRYVLVRRLSRKDREFAKTTSESTLRERLIILGHVENEELRALYRHARVFFFPSLVEGFGLPIIEAMASGCPVVTSNQGAMAEVAGDAAWLCSPNDVDAMAFALSNAVEESETRNDKIRMGVDQATEFDFQSCAERTLEAYRLLVPQSK